MAACAVLNEELAFCKDVKSLNPDRVYGVDVEVKAFVVPEEIEAFFVIFDEVFDIHLHLVEIKAGCHLEEG